MTHDTDALGLLADIIAHPEDDTPIPHTMAGPAGEPLTAHVVGCTLTCRACGLARAAAPWLHEWIDRKTMEGRDTSDPRMV